MKTSMMVGKRFGRLEVLGLSSKRSGTHAYVWCQCDCGELVLARGNAIRCGNTTSCGCFHRERSAEWNQDNFTSHGMRKTSEYGSWHGMKRRCLNSGHKYFHYYGGRGITVCPEWVDDFAAFYAHIGPKPEPKRLYSLDRIDNDGNYEPGNVRWATASQQACNRRKQVTPRITQLHETGA